MTCRHLRAPSAAADASTHTRVGVDQQDAARAAALATRSPRTRVTGLLALVSAVRAAVPEPVEPEGMTAECVAPAHARGVPTCRSWEHSQVRDAALTRDQQLYVVDEDAVWVYDLGRFTRTRLSAEPWVTGNPCEEAEHVVGDVERAWAASDGCFGGNVGVFGASARVVEMSEQTWHVALGETLDVVRAPGGGVLSSWQRVEGEEDARLFATRDAVVVLTDHRVRITRTDGLDAAGRSGDFTGGGAAPATPSYRLAPDLWFYLGLPTHIGLAPVHPDKAACGPPPALAVGDAAPVYLRLDDACQLLQPLDAGFAPWGERWTLGGEETVRYPALPAVIALVGPALLVLRTRRRGRPETVGQVHPVGEPIRDTRWLVGAPARASAVIVQRLLENGRRLQVWTGPPRSGKTSVLLQVLADVSGRRVSPSPRPVWFICGQHGTPEQTRVALERALLVAADLPPNTPWQAAAETITERQRLGRLGPLVLLLDEAQELYPDCRDGRLDPGWNSMRGWLRGFTQAHEPDIHIGMCGVYLVDVYKAEARMGVVSSLLAISPVGDWLRFNNYLSPQDARELLVRGGEVGGYVFDEDAMATVLARASQEDYRAVTVQRIGAMIYRAVRRPRDRRTATVNRALVDEVLGQPTDAVEAP